MKKIALFFIIFSVHLGLDSKPLGVDLRAPRRERGTTIRIPRLQPTRVRSRLFERQRALDRRMLLQILLMQVQLEQVSEIIHSQNDTSADENSESSHEE